MEKEYIINLFGIGWHFITLVIVMLSIYLSTKIFKNRGFLKRLPPAVQSWVFAVLIYVPLAIFKPEVVEFWGIAQYIFLTLLVNGAYKGNKTLWRFLAKKFTFIGAPKS